MTAAAIPATTHSRIAYHDFWIANGSVYIYMVSMPDDNSYRVEFISDGIDVICFGLESIDAKVEGHYDRIDDLPDWVQERLAVLMVISPKPPTPEVDKVGRRINETVFWVYAPEPDASASA